MNANPPTHFRFIYVVLWASQLVQIAVAAPVDFVRDVAPIFQQHCVHCHNESKTSGDLSLSQSKGLRELDLIVPGKPAESSLLDAIIAEEGEASSMPEEGTPLTLKQVEVIRQWIAEGAKWPADFVVQQKAKADGTWWSLQPVAEVSLPDAKPTRSSHPIDLFIQRRLNKEGLTSSIPADRRTLIRRVYYDLIGLSPTPEAVAEFLADHNPDAYERLVNRLLDSKHFGERWARHWLDIAHYGDTHGFERDKLRDNAWRYRDYVIRSFNADLPYDQFLREQIAGDVIAPEDAKSVIATGFLAAGPWDYVGQVETKSLKIRRAARALDLDDMVTQVMTATMAMTVNCARCHDHKLDPITQKEYYQLTAVFAGLKRSDRVISEESRKAYEAEKTRLETAINRVEVEIGQAEGRVFNLADVVGNGNGLGAGKKDLGIDARSGKFQDRPYGDLGNVKPGNYAGCTNQFIDGVFVPAGERTQITSTELFATDMPANSGKAWDMIRNGPVSSQFSTTFGEIDYNLNGHSMIGLHANAGISFDVNAIRNVMIEIDSAREEVAAIKFSTVVGYGGKTVAPSAEFRIYLDGELQTSQRIGRNAAISVDFQIPQKAQFLTLISSDGGNGYGHDQVSFGDPHISRTVPLELTVQKKQQLAQLRQERGKLKQELATLGEPPILYGVVAEKPPAVHVLLRGDPETAGEEVSPGGLSWSETPRIFGDQQLGEGERRLALAEWIVDPSNPLTARVIVNRLWHLHFGYGIVGTPSDFGYGGSQPSHPELLDWLAAELIRQNWSLKAIHRLIVTSETYRQASLRQESAVVQDGTDPKLVDSDNRLLWRMNARRLEAEAVRDSVLAVSGNLNQTMYGPGYRDFVYKEAYAPIYTYKTADSPELWRRSVYRFVVRTTPSPFMTALDCPNPANLTPKRNVTTTALQSLAMYNNDFMLRQSRYWAERIQREADEPDAQIDRAFQLAFVRSPTKLELASARKLIADQGLLHLCRALLNANEFVYLD